MDKTLRVLLKFLTDNWLFFIVFPVGLLAFLVVLTPVIYYFGYHSLANNLYAFFRVLCHQLDSRSLFIFGRKMAVCSRDFALYSSFFIGSLSWVITKKKLALKYFLILLLPLALDAGTQGLGLRESANFLRILTGSLAGIATAYFILPRVELVMQKVREEVTKS